MSMLHLFLSFPFLPFYCSTLTAWFNLHAVIQRGILCALSVGCNRWRIEHLNSGVE